MLRKKDGFNAQRAIVLPQAVIKQCEQNTVIAHLHITDIGFYPKARFHYRHRENGSPQNILIYCVDGKGWAKVDDREIDISQGGYLILPQHVKHIYGADEEKPWSIFWVHFKGDTSGYVTKLLKQANENFYGSVSYNKDRIALFDNMYNTLKDGYSIANLNYVNMQLWYYLATFCYGQLFTPLKENKEDEIEEAIKFMHEHINELLLLEDIARHIHRSGSHFSALFKKKTGYSPLEYFNHIKIQRACQMLEFSDVQVKALAYQLGYKDPFYFSRLFTKFMGQSPTEYRKRKKFD